MAQECLTLTARFATYGRLTSYEYDQLGRVKRIAISEFASVRAGGLIAIGLEPGDELRFALVTSGGQELTIVTAGGQALRFGEDEVRPMGRGAGGVNGIKLDEGDEVVALNLVEPGAALAVVSEKGWAKRTPLAEYPLQGRYGKGVVALPAKYLAQTGKLVAATVVAEGDDLGVATSSGCLLYTSPSPRDRTRSRMPSSA